MLGWGLELIKSFYKNGSNKSFFFRRPQQSSARFDPKKITWFNQRHIQDLNNSVLKKLLVEDLNNENIKFHENKLDQIINLIKPRLSLTTDVFKKSKFFSRSSGFDKKDLKNLKKHRKR